MTRTIFSARNFLAISWTSLRARIIPSRGRGTSYCSRMSPSPEWDGKYPCHARPATHHLPQIPEKVALHCDFQVPFKRLRRVASACPIHTETNQPMIEMTRLMNAARMLPE
jgi:hypothetical protein